MQAIKVSNRVLLNCNDKLTQIQSDDFITYMLLFSRIRQWFGDNNIRIKSIFDKIHKLQEEYFVIEGEGDKRQIAKEEVPPIPSVPAVYETKIIRKGTWFLKEITEQVVKTPAIPEKPQPARPVMKEGKDREEFYKKYEALLDAETEMKF